MIGARDIAKIIVYAGLVLANGVMAAASILVWIPASTIRRRRWETHARAVGRLVVVAPFAPGDQSGGAKAVEGLMRILRSDQRDVALVVPGGGSNRKFSGALGAIMLAPLPMPDQCRSLLLGSRGINLALRQSEIVIFEFAASAIYLIWGRLRGRRCVLRDHEVLVRKLWLEMSSAVGAEALVLFLRLAVAYAVSAALYVRADTIVTLTEEDCQAVRRFFPFVAGRAVVVPAPFQAPSVVELQYSQHCGRNLLMVANFFHGPNIDGLAWFLANCAPRLRAEYTLHLCGLDEPLNSVVLNGPNIRVVRHGFIEKPSEILSLSNIAIAPIVSGGGVRIKNLFVGSMGLALITTALGNEGIGFVHNRHALICTDAASMASAIDRLAEQPEQALRLGRAAQAYIRHHFDPDRVRSGVLAAVYGKDF